MHERGEENLIILGIDPGFAITGVGVIEYKNNKFKVLDYGAITTDSGLKLSQRLLLLYNKLENVIIKYNPDVVAIEELFFNKNIKTALNVGHGRGVVLLAAAKNNKKIFEYTPLQVKQSVVGYGRAEKNQVQQMVKMILNLKSIPKPDDVADALAVAVCCAHSNKIGEEGS